MCVQSLLRDVDTYMNAFLVIAAHHTWPLWAKHRMDLWSIHSTLNGPSPGCCQQKLLPNHLSNIFQQLPKAAGAAYTDIHRTVQLTAAVEDLWRVQPGQWTGTGPSMEKFLP
jgi:hypothetical protein